MKTLIITIICLFTFFASSNAQPVAQTVSGRIVDKSNFEGLPGATIVLAGSDPIIGTTSDLDGYFSLPNVSIGRHDFEIRMLGYTSYLQKGVAVNSGKEVTLEILLKPSNNTLEEVVVSYQKKSGEVLNTMATLSSRQFTVEEGQRYAGGLNDPARLVSSFAGVASTSTSSNGISIRGNSPSGLLWRIEGVDIPSPNHFADLSIAGAGFLTILSSHVMGNSDFFTGAFPAEYGNATSGVFDMKIRRGNQSKHEHTFQAGLLGLDFASEGPLKAGKNASYIMNYRYSTLGLIGALLPNDAGILKYQDLSFKFNVPTSKYGTFSLWGLGGYDAINNEALPIEEWESNFDRENSQTSLHMFASGLNHKIQMKENAFLTTTLAISGNGLNHEEQRLDYNLNSNPLSQAHKTNYRVTFQSSINSYWGDKHVNKTGFYFNHLGYNLSIYQALHSSNELSKVVDETGSSNLIQVFSQSKYRLSSKFTLNMGIHFQYFQLNKKNTLEPRVAINYKVNRGSEISIAYGLHSKNEPLPIYFIGNNETNQSNRNLDFMKSNHFVLSYSTLINDKIKITIEPYYQYLNNVPVTSDGYISTLNTEENLFFDHLLTSKGKGRNVGIDFTLERFFNNGIYYLCTASIFDSKYTGNDGVTRNVRFNKNFVFNALIGKEWQIGKSKNNILSANFRFNYLPGNRKEPIDLARSYQEKEVIYGETSEALAFSEKHPDTPILSFSLSYRRNKKKYSSIWSLQFININRAQEFQSDYFNLNNQTVEQQYSKIIVPNLSYKIEF